MDRTCTICRQTFSKHSNLRNHLKKFHPDKLNEIAPNKTFKCVAKCDKCLKSFSKYSNLKRHVVKFHPENVNELIPFKLHPYQCSECQKQFLHLNNLRRHKRIHVSDVEITKKKRELKCSMCEYTSTLKSNLILHLEEHHKIKMESQELCFSNELEFQKWKTDWEKENSCLYVTYSHPYMTTEGTKKVKYVCHRSGFFVTSSKGLRRLKTQGTKKINGICPSELKVSILKNCSILVHFIQTHVGHDNDLDHLNIPDTDRIEIACKIASKIPFTSILDEVKDSVTNNKLARVHLLTRKDLHNISQSFNLNSEKELGKGHSTSQDFDIDPGDLSGMGWEVPSSLTNNEVYMVQKNQLDEDFMDDGVKIELFPEVNIVQLETEKQKLMNLHIEMINKISSFDQLEAFKSIVAPLESLVCTLGNEEECDDGKNVPQTLVCSPKKKDTSPEKGFLTKSEPQEMIYQLLQTNS